MFALVVPRMIDEWLKNEYVSRENLGIQYISASLEKEKITYKLFNAHAYNLSHEDVCEEIMLGSFSLVGVSCISQRSYIHVKNFIATLVEYGYKGIIFMGGFFATLAVKEILNDIPQLAFILAGECEKTIPAIIRRIEKNEEYHDIPGVTCIKRGNIVQLTPPNYETDLDSLPFPHRDMGVFHGLNSSDVVMRLLAGRGCYGNCTFCSIAMHNRPKKKIYRTPENVVAELQKIVSLYDVRQFQFNDEVFYVNNEFGKKWVQNFVDLIHLQRLSITFSIQMKATDVSEKELALLKSAGLKSVSVGYESGVQRILQEMRKGTMIEDNINASKIIRKMSLEAPISFIMLVPSMSIDELVENYNFIEQIGGYTSFNLYNKLNVYYGCEYEQILEEKGLLKKRSTFYERDNYTYSDRKVEIFSNYIEKMKLTLMPFRKRLNDITVNIFDYHIVQKYARDFAGLNDLHIVMFLKSLLKYIYETELSVIDESYMDAQLEYCISALRSDFERVIVKGM